MKPARLLIADILLAALMVVGIIVIANGMHGNDPRCVMANLCEEVK